MPRLKRPEQAALNRERVLEAAGRIFRNKGFHGSSLDEISDEAGFSKGVIYSQFGSKDDLALALIEQRMEWRVAQTMELMKQVDRRGEATPEATLRIPLDTMLRQIWERNQAIQLADREWPLFVLEFRIHSARTPEVNRRYQALHGKTLARLTRVFEVLISRVGLAPQHEPADFARFLSAIDGGMTLEALAAGLGSDSDMARDAVRLLLTESAPEPSEEGEEAR